jgi:hypothetical protein
MNKVFSPLKLSILDDPSKAYIFFLDSEYKSQWVPLFSDANILITDAPATDPPMSNLDVSMTPLNLYEFWNDYDMEPPNPLRIENMDDRLISAKQLIHATHDYAVPLRDLLHGANSSSIRDFGERPATGGGIVKICICGCESLRQPPN